jgi:WD40 repeat protein
MVIKYDFTETDWHYCHYDMNSNASKHDYLKKASKVTGGRSDNLVKSSSSYCHNDQIEKEYSIKIDEAFKNVVAEKKKKAEDMKIKDPKRVKADGEVEEEREKVTEKKSKMKPIEMGKVVKGVYEKRRWIHKGWITKIKFYFDLNYLVSSSLDGFIHIHDIENISYKAKTFNLHQKGINSFVYSTTHRFIASCGEERYIIMWDPFTRGALAYLYGHNTSV